MKALLVSMSGKSERPTILKVRRTPVRKSGGTHKAKKAYDRKRDKRSVERRTRKGWDI